MTKIPMRRLDNISYDCMMGLRCREAVGRQVGCKCRPFKDGSITTIAKTHSPLKNQSLAQVRTQAPLKVTERVATYSCTTGMLLKVITECKCFGTEGSSLNGGVGFRLFLTGPEPHHTEILFRRLADNPLSDASS
jgi:hypothetical protein